MTLRSLAANTPSRRANWRALGLSLEDMEKPKIAVVNSSSELAICYAHLDGIAKIVKEEIRAAGGDPVRGAHRRAVGLHHRRQQGRSATSSPGATSSPTTSRSRSKRRCSTG